MTAVPGKVQVVHNGVDFEEYERSAVPRGQLRRRLGLAPEDFLVGFTGNLIERKGIATLVRAAARMLEGGRSVDFVVLGRVPVGTSRSYLRGCERLVERSGIGDRFRFLGFTPDVRPAVADLDLLVLPSLQEPFGRSVIESMALGVPVVASDVGGIPEIIEDGVSGVLVPPGDDRALADAIRRLLDDDELRGRISAAGLRSVRERFDVARLTRSIEQQLDEAVGR
jgi:glycosyltransferase involved in cell wall biosynthesis